LSCPDTRPNAIVKSFQDRYREWLSIVDNRVWAFLFGVSLNRVIVLDELTQIFSSINNYINKTTDPSGELIAVWSTAQGIRSEFNTWEASNPAGTSSFSFVRAQEDTPIPPTHLHTAFSRQYVHSLEGREIWSHLHKPVVASPTNKLPGLVIVSADGAIVDGFSPDEIAQIGYVVVHYDRSGKGHSKGPNNYGGPADQADLKQVVNYLRGLDFVDPSNIGLISLGFGLSIAAGAIDTGLDVDYLLDWEGPSNRHNISANDKSENFGQFPVTDDGFWDPREPYKTIRSFKGRYQRVQASIDHFQGTDMSHAIQMVNAATHSTYGGQGQTSLSILNGNPANQTYNPAEKDSAINPIFWIQGESIVQIAEDYEFNILQFFKFIAGYAKLNLSLIVTISDRSEYEDDSVAFNKAADRLRALANAMERADAKLSILTENAFIEGTRNFSDHILTELAKNHSGEWPA